MRRTVSLVAAALAAGAITTLALVTIASAMPPCQLALTGIEPGTLVSQRGGTLSIYGSGFDAATVARLVGFGLLDTAYINAAALTAVVPPGVPASIYDLEVSDAVSSVTLPSALTIVDATPTPRPTALPKPKATTAPGRPVLTIRNYATEPSRVVVGREFIVTVEIYNTGSRAGENTIVAFPGGTFLPVGETGHLLWQLHINHTAVVTQRMRVPSGLSSGSYNLQVNLSANDWEGNHYEYPQTVAVEVIGIGHGRPQLVIEATRTEPDVLGPGDAFSLTLQMVNRGDRSATDVLVGVASTDLAVPASGSNFVAIEPVGINQTGTVTLPLVLGEVTQAGRLDLEIALDYSDYYGGSYTSRQSVGLEASTALADRPQLLVARYDTEPAPLSPGDVFTLALEVSNVGGGEAQRLTLTLGGEGGNDLEPFAPIASSNVRFVPHIAAGSAVELVQRLVVDGSAEPGVYSLPVALAYDDARGTRHTDSQRISLLVHRRPHFQIDFYNPVGVAIVGVPFNLPVEVINIGRTLVNVSTLEVSSEQLDIQDGSLYLGPLDGGTSGSLEAMAVAQEGGMAGVLVTVRYLDDFDQSQVVTRTLTVEVAEPEPIAPESELSPEEQEESPWDKVLRFIRGLFGLGS
jgi:hypothetical protein